jgi:thioredoxin-dependent peroxiredoxin
MSGVTVGKAVKDFSLPSTASVDFQLRAARGKPLLLYFYPRDNTPGCTLEAQDFQRLLPAFRSAGVRICGISRDSLAAHQKFCSQFGLGFELLVDAQGVACQLFDVIHEKNMYGRKVVGIVRSTFLIDATGKLRQEWRKVKVAGHAAAVLEAAKAL